MVENLLITCDGLFGQAAAPDLLILILKLIELPINTTHREQFLVGADLAELAFVHDDDAVGALDGREAMRDDDGCAALHQMFKRRANPQLGFGIHARSGFVQNQEARVVRERTSEIDELFLAGGISGATFAHRLRKTFG